MNDQLPYILPLLMGVARYFLLAGIPFLVFYLLFPDFFAKNKIQQRWAQRRDFLREIWHSMQTTLVLAVVGLLVLRTPLRNYTQFYIDLADYPWWWIPVSLVLALVLHDTYFYWMHRAVHHPSLYRHIHLVHHQSVNPSPWTSYSFHFFEAVLEALVAPLILLLIPMHPLALILFTFLGFVVNVYGHLGYEIAPRWFRHSVWFEILNSSLYHNMHHEQFRGNYGLYFRFWDRLLGTEHPDYVKQYDTIQARRFGESPVGNKRSIRLWCGVLMTMLGASSLMAQPTIEGEWKDSVDGGVVRIYESDGYYFGELLYAEKDEENEKIEAYGKPIVLMQYFQRVDDSNYCCGMIYQPRERRKISATLALTDETTLVIHGRYGIFTGQRVWTRM